MDINDKIYFFKKYNECFGANYAFDTVLSKPKIGIIKDIKEVDYTNYNVPWNIFEDRVKEYTILDREGVLHKCSHFNSPRYDEWICSYDEYNKLLEDMIKKNNEKLRNLKVETNLENFILDCQKEKAQKLYESYGKDSFKLK